MKELIQKHKRLAIAIGISLVLLLIILAFFVMLLIGGSSNKYGNRLDGIDEVTANHIYGTVVIKINKNVDLEKAKETIEDLGFEIEEN